jgi:hypothetical protein
MNFNNTPINRALSVLLMFILSCASGTMLAQDDDKPEAVSKTFDTPNSAPSAAPPEPQAANENSPTDYQASEEISQDLSVSFPADI